MSAHDVKQQRRWCTNTHPAFNIGCNISAVEDKSLCVVSRCIRPQLLHPVRVAAHEQSIRCKCNTLGTPQIYSRRFRDGCAKTDRCSMQATDHFSDRVARLENSSQQLWNTFSDRTFCSLTTMTGMASRHNTPLDAYDACFQCNVVPLRYHTFGSLSSSMLGVLF